MTYTDGIRARGIAAAEISDTDMTVIIDEALFEYSRYRPIIADLTFDAVADQQRYTWTQAGDATGLSIIACLWNPAGSIDVWESQTWLVSRGLDLIGGEWHWPSLDVIEDIKNAAWQIDNGGTAFQNDGDGGDIWLDPTPSEADCTVFLLYSKPHSSTTTIKASDRDMFLDLIESACSSWLANTISKASAASDIKTPEYEIKGNSVYKYWATRGSEARQRFIDKCNAGRAAVART